MRLRRALKRAGDACGEEDVVGQFEMVVVVPLAIHFRNESVRFGILWFSN
jgi:hypothetical protein